MKVAIIGSRGLQLPIDRELLPKDTEEIVSGGAKGIDQCARQLAVAHHIAYTEFLPDYRRYGRGAPLRRNQQIVDYSDHVMIFWDGVSRGTQFVINICKTQKKPYTLYLCENGRINNTCD